MISPVLCYVCPVVGFFVAGMPPRAQVSKPGTRVAGSFSQLEEIASMPITFTGKDVDGEDQAE
jgi:hypothetical protein